MESAPNLLVLVLDQLRHDALGCAGGVALTPAVDALAARGTRFTQAHCAIPTCCPSRQSLLTGRRPEELGHLWNYDIGSRIPALEPSQPTWTRTLAESGYRSWYLGKWHVNPDHDPTAFGYERYEPLREEAPATGAGRGPNAGVPWRGEVDDRPLSRTGTHWLAGRAVQALHTLAGQGSPWHLRVDWVEPHLPCRPRPEFLDRYRDAHLAPWPSLADDGAGKPWIQEQQRRTWGVDGWTTADWTDWLRHYYAVVTQVDDAIGQVLDALEASGQAGRTIVVLTSDHGDMAGSHRMIDKHYVQYDDVVRVPLVLAGPGIATAVRSDLVYNSLDLVPTLTELLDLDWEPGPGRSLVPLLRAAPPDSVFREAVVTSFNGQQSGLFTQRAIRTRDWKYVWNATDVDELYDLAADPWELRNMVTEPATASVLADLRARLLETLRAEGDPQMDNPWVEAQLARDPRPVVDV